MFYFIVSSMLEFGSIIWDPRRTELINKIERVKNRFLRELAFKINRIDV